MSILEKAKEAYEKALEMESKLAATIERHEKSFQKELDKLAAFGITAENMTVKKWKEGKAGTGGGEYYWEICKAESKKYDLESAKAKMVERKKITAAALDKLGASKQQMAIFEQLPAIILEFAARYKARCIRWLLDGAEEYRELLKEAYKLEGQERTKRVRAVNAAFGGEIRRIASYYGPDRENEATKIAETNRVDLLKLLAARVMKKCGRITDAKGLVIGDNGEINGRVIGDKGAATITTIGAGGYNIQCFHYRVLVR